MILCQIEVNLVATASSAGTGVSPKQLKIFEERHNLTSLLCWILGVPGYFRH